ncbi:nuclear protein export protein [Pseudohyphozyma bogoriensis]|nr:nuclear protein export protein [Pseudohyphozyma bogoriensis]
MDNPWGSDETPAPFPDRVPSPPLPSFGSATLNVSSQSWGDDGGWGGSSDDYMPSTGFGSSTASGMEEYTEEVEPEPTQASSSYDAGGGWGPPDDLPPVSSTFQSNHDDLYSHTKDLSLNASPPSGFAPSPPLATMDLPTFRSSSPPPAQDDGPEEPVEEEAEDDWGAHGQSPTLPPIADLKLPSTSPETSRTGGWGDDDEWQPAEIPPPLPSFGDSFTKSSAGAGKTDETDEWGDGGSWGGGQGGSQRRASAEGGGQEQEGWGGVPTQGLHRGKSIPAALVDGLKVDSRKFADSNWTVSSDSWDTGGFQEQPATVASLITSLSEAPALPPSSSITNDTPLPSLFRLTPTLYPNFRDGLDKTALRTAETLKGSSSAAYRNARFGRISGPRKSHNNEEPARGQSGDMWDLQSGLGTPDLVSERGHAGDEFDLDAPGRAAPAKSSWWGSSASTSTPTNMPKSLLVKKAEDIPTVEEPTTPRTASPAPADSAAAPSVVGRFFGRFGRKASPVQSPRTSGEASRDVEGSGDQLESAGRLSQIAQAKVDSARMDDDLSGFFGDRPAASRAPAAAAADDFGGLMDAFSEAPKKPAARKVAKTLDPFDPFADDVDETPIPPPIAPSPTSPLRQGGAGNRALSPPISTTSRSVSPLPYDQPYGQSYDQPYDKPYDHVEPARKANPSFPTVVAPQARTVSALATTQDDAFDSFFGGPSATSPSPSSASTSSAPIPRTVGDGEGEETKQLGGLTPLAKKGRVQVAGMPSKDGTDSNSDNESLPAEEGESSSGHASRKTPPPPAGIEGTSAPSTPVVHGSSLPAQGEGKETRAIRQRVEALEWEDGAAPGGTGEDVEIAQVADDVATSAAKVQSVDEEIADVADEVAESAQHLDEGRAKDVAAAQVADEVSMSAAGLAKEEDDKKEEDTEIAEVAAEVGKSAASADQKDEELSDVGKVTTEVGDSAALVDHQDEEKQEAADVAAEVSESAAKVDPKSEVASPVPVPATTTSSFSTFSSTASPFSSFSSTASPFAGVASKPAPVEAQKPKAKTIFSTNPSLAPSTPAPSSSAKTPSSFGTPSSATPQPAAPPPTPATPFGKPSAAPSVMPGSPFGSFASSSGFSAVTGSSSGSGFGSYSAATASPFAKVQASTPAPTETPSRKLGEPVEDDPEKKVFTEQEVITGEEQDENVHSVRAKLYVMADGAWAERGTGLLKLNLTKDTDRSGARLVMRADATHRLLLNAVLFAKFVIEVFQEKYVRFAIIEGAEPVSYMLRMSGPTTAQALVKAVTDQVALL